MIKKIFSLIFVLCLVIGAFVIFASAADETEIDYQQNNSFEYELSDYNYDNYFINFQTVTVNTNLSDENEFVIAHGEETEIRLNHLVLKELLG